jgi:ADP-ribose pyrophosphatase YjhB (NUDIX family)
MGDDSLPQRVKPTVSRGTDKNPPPSYPRPIVAVDTALLTWDAKRGLVVVEMWRDDVGKWALPGVFVRKGETLAQAVERCLHDKLGVEGVRPRQLHVLDDPNRDHRDWVISVAHVAVVRPEQLHSLGSGAAGDTRLAPVDRPGELAWDHPEIVRHAKTDVRERYAAYPDPDRLLGPRFTLRELRQVHEAVAGEHFGRDKFRRAMEDTVERTGVIEETGTRGRPAELFRRKQT